MRSHRRRHRAPESTELFPLPRITGMMPMWVIPVESGISGVEFHWHGPRYLGAQVVLGRHPYAMADIGELLRTERDAFIELLETLTSD